MSTQAKADGDCYEDAQLANDVKYINPLPSESLMLMIIRGWHRIDE